MSYSILAFISFSLAYIHAYFNFTKLRKMCILWWHTSLVLNGVSSDSLQFSLTVMFRSYKLLTNCCTFMNVCRTCLLSWQSFLFILWTDKVIFISGEAALNSSAVEVECSWPSARLLPWQPRITIATWQHSYLATPTIFPVQICQILDFSCIFIIFYCY